MDWLRQLPMGQYVDGDQGWIRRVDVRLKLAWTLAFLITPILANGAWRLGLVGLLLLLTALSGLPWLLWRRLLPLLLAASCLVGAVFLVIPSVSTVPQAPQRPSAEVRLLPTDAPRSAAGAPWQLWQWGPVGRPPLQLGPLTVNRTSLDLALRSGTLLFTLVHSANLLLISTPAEDLAWAFAWILRPLRGLGIPTTELGFMLLLSLRFLPLVQEEFQNLLRAVATRSFQLRQLGLKGSMALLLGLGERLLANLLLRAEQGAEALMARGGRLLPPSTLEPRPTPARIPNACALALLVLLMALRWRIGGPWPL
ncbi:MAG: energy-coupling factor transporter transmembrane protein EcfT [Cyanobacteria bacterium MAG CAR4_bin_6]|nr:energy-coupling factor transporter transmembrane protein EcfT [Cyanobacteria bacterium MAG CAR4_bin_6]